jgi:methionine sulfoxide reductase heme-binding subunit
VRLLVAALAVTPLRRVFPRAGWAQWLVRRRRDLGVAVFAYAALHLAIYLVRKAPAPELILREALDAGMALGWIAFVLFAVLAATSNDASVRGLGRRWKALHRWVYAAAALTIGHWVMTAFDPLAGWIYGAVLLALGLLRLVPQSSPRAG